MSELVVDCPRCKAKSITFDLINEIIIRIEYDWQHWFEAFCICRACHKSTTFILTQKDIHHTEKIKQKGLAGLGIAVNRYVSVFGYVNIKDLGTGPPPDHLPKNIEAAFREGSACMAIGCVNAAGTMFRLCIDLATRSLLPKGEVDNLNSKTRRNLGLRLPWLFDHGIIPDSLRELSSCIKEDGNDGAHEGTLSKEDADDIYDFTYMFLERIYTETKRIELAKARRIERRGEAI